MALELNYTLFCQIINATLILIITYSLIHFVWMHKLPNVMEILMAGILFMVIYLVYLSFTQKPISIMVKQINNEVINIPTPTKDIFEPTTPTKKPWEVCMGLLDAKTPAELVEISKELQVTTSDAILKRDGSSMNPHFTDDPNEARRLYALTEYPTMTGEQINKHDCLNDQANGDSCFQSPNFFSKINNDPMRVMPALNNNLNPAGKAIMDFQKELKLKEGFTADMVMQPSKDSFSKSFTSPYQEIPVAIAQDFGMYPMHHLYQNAPGDVDNRERDISSDLCRHCKVGICYNNYCGLQNKFFM